MTRFTSILSLASAVMVGAWAWAQTPVPLQPNPNSLPYLSTSGETEIIGSPSTTYMIRRLDGTFIRMTGPLPGTPGSALNGPVMQGEAPSYPDSRSGVMPSMTGPPMRIKLIPRTVYESQMVPMTQDEKLEIEACQVATATLRSDKSDAEKTQARAVLAQLLLKQFDRDLATREKDVVELETRVKKLRDQFDKRKAAKDKIIELRLTTIQNEIDGLGFPGTGLGEGSTLPQPGPGFGPVQFFNGGGQLTPAPESNIDSFLPDPNRPVPAEQTPSSSPGLGI